MSEPCVMCQDGQGDDCLCPLEVSDFVVAVLIVVFGGCAALWLSVIADLIRGRS